MDVAIWSVFFCSYKKNPRTKKSPGRNHGFPMKTLPKKAYTPIFPKKSKKGTPIFSKKIQKGHPYFSKKNPKKTSLFCQKNEEFLHTLLDCRGFPVLGERNSVFFIFWAFGWGNSCKKMSSSRHNLFAHRTVKIHRFSFKKVHKSKKICAREARANEEK